MADILLSFEIGQALKIYDVMDVLYRHVTLFENSCTSCANCENDVTSSLKRNQCIIIMIAQFISHENMILSTNAGNQCHYIILPVPAHRND